MRTSLVGLAVVAVLTGCPGPGGGGDDASIDAGIPDAGVVDSGAPDSGIHDAGPVDAGKSDAGVDAGCGWTLPAVGTSGGCPTGSPGPIGAAAATLPRDGGANVFVNITYGTRGGRVLQGDLFVPTPGTAPRGILVMVHGGGWLDCDQRRNVLNPYAVFFSDSFNVAVFNIEYRLLQEGGSYPSNLGDVKCAVQYITAHAGDYGLDATKVAILGESAGAHLALMTALTQDRADLDPGCSAIAAKVNAAIAYSPVSDLPALAASTSVAKGAPGIYAQSMCLEAISRCGASCDRCLDASPRAHACSATVPITIVHAPDPYDGLLPMAQSTTMAAALLDAGATVKLVIPTAASVAAQTWNGLPCTADAGIAHGFQSQCLLIPTYPDLAAAVKAALGP